jgi:hypothetical protein
MKRAVLTLGFVALVTTEAAAQWLGEPVWNSPKGGTGLTISGDYAAPNSNYGASTYSKGHTWGGRAALGLGTVSFELGVASWKPEGAGQSFTSVGGNAAFRLIGGSLLPVAVNLQVGAARTDSANLTPASTRVIGAVGFSIPLPTPGLSIEPFFSPGLRHTSVSGPTGASQTEFGYAIGANIGLGTLGVHLAYDSEKQPGSLPSRGVFGIGAHLDIHLPLGM